MRTSILALSLTLSACAVREPPTQPARSVEETLDTSFVQPIPAPTALDPGRVALGKRLFHEPRLSGNNKISCATCHDLTQGGVDPREAPTGANGDPIPIDAPTVFNAGLNFRQFWNGRASSLEEQINGPILAAGEMGSTWPAVVEKLSQDPSYAQEFERLYPDGVTPDNIRNAIATFERSLLTTNSSLDRFLRGERGALSENAKHGFRLFAEFGCSSCHQGVGLGGNMYQVFGVMEDAFAARTLVRDVDLGRYLVTGQEDDLHVFKVPTLRNVAKTGPYFHDGSAETLEQAVRVMAQYQLGRDLDAGEVVALVEFLHALTGEYQGKPL